MRKKIEKPNKESTNRTITNQTDMWTIGLVHFSGKKIIIIKKEKEISCSYSIFNFSEKLHQ